MTKRLKGGRDLLPENVTLSELIADGRLDNPHRYLRMALGNMLLAGDFGKVTLRIGRSGKGSRPHYALECGGGPVSRFNPQNHQLWADGYTYNQERWSKTAISAAELHALWQKVTDNA